MAILKAVNVKIGRNANLKGIINYVLRPEKTEDQLTTGYFCDVPDALKTFSETKEAFGKQKGRQYYHFVQSFPPNENLTAKQAHEAAVKFAEKCKKFRGFEMIIVTHKDRNHLHTHFVMNSVSFLDGHKFHITKKELAEMKEMQNQLCIQLGYSAAPKKGFDMYGNRRKEITANNSKTFRLLKKANENQKDSYLIDCRKAFVKSMKMAGNKDQFIQLMHAQGFETEWKDNKKHITFTDIKRRASGEKKSKTRLKKLSQYFPELKDFKTKEDLINGFTGKSKSRITDKSVSTGPAVAADNTDKSKTGSVTGVIDFNSRFEQYASNVDRKRAVHAAEKAARRKSELAEKQRAELESAAGKNKQLNAAEQSKTERDSGREQESGGLSW